MKTIKFLHKLNLLIVFIVMSNIAIGQTSVNCPPNVALCLDAQPMPLSGATPTGGTYAGNGVTGPAGGYYFFNPSIAGVGNHAITYTYQGNSCQFMIEVKELPVLQCPGNIFVHAGYGPFLLNATPSGGYFYGYNISTIVFYGQDGWYFDTETAGIGAHPVVYSYLDPITYCSNTCVFVVYVDVQIEVFCPDDIETCINFEPFGLFGAEPAGGAYSGPGVTGPDGQGVYTFSPSAAGEGAHQISYSINGPEGSISCYFTITVFPLPELICPSNQFVALSTPAFDLPAGVPSGGHYEGTGVYIGQSANYVFDPGWAGVGIHNITYTYGDTHDCQNSCEFTIEVYEQIIVTCPDDWEICEDFQPFYLFGASPAGGFYSGPGVTGPDGQGNYTFTPSAAGVGVHTIDYFYYLNDLIFSCSLSITVFPLPQVGCPPNQIVEVSTPAFDLSGETPSGGYYSGTGVYQGQTGGWVFDPGYAGLGIHIITYTFMDGHDCQNSCDFTIEVYEQIAISCPEDMELCSGSPSFYLIGGSPLGGVYSGTGVSGPDGQGMYSFNPMVAGTGVHTISYMVQGVGGPYVCTFTITVHELPLVTCPPSQMVAHNSGLLPLNAQPSGGSFSGIGVYQVQSGGWVFDPALAGVGVHIITYTFMDGHDCQNSCNFTIEVYEQITVICPENFSASIFIPPFDLTGATPTGGIYSGIGVYLNTETGVYYFDPERAGLGIHTITYTINSDLYCIFTIQVYDPVGINDSFSQVIQLLIYPNPVDQLLTVQILPSSADIKQVRVTCISGNLIKELVLIEGRNTITLETNTLHKGMYILLVETQYGWLYRKFIVTR